MARMEVTLGDSPHDETEPTDGPVTITFQDSRGDDYELVVESREESIDIILKYPDGDRLALESIVQSSD